MKQSIDNIFHWFNGLSTFVKVISSVFVVVTTVSGAIATYNNWIVKKYESKIVVDLKQVNEKLGIITEKAKDTDNAIKIINENQVIISGQVQEVSGQFNVLTRKFDTQTSAMSNHFQKENMLQDNINFLQELINDEKKNNKLNQSGGI